MVDTPLTNFGHAHFIKSFIHKLLITLKPKLVLARDLDERLNMKKHSNSDILILIWQLPAHFESSLDCITRYTMFRFMTSKELHA